MENDSNVKLLGEYIYLLNNQGGIDNLTNNHSIIVEDSDSLLLKIVTK